MLRATAFKQDEVLANSFEIFVKTADYEKQINAIETIITSIKNTFRDSKEIDQVIADVSTLIDSLRIPAIPATRFGRYPAIVSGVTQPVSERSDAEPL